MGIRYYAYPVPPELGDLAKQSPRDFVGRDPLMDAWGPPEERPRMLYLDKCWRELQSLFAPSESRVQPAYELVRGEVTHTPEGWIPFLRYLANEDLRTIAADLADAEASECFVMAGVEAFCRARPWADDVEAELHYVQAYLRDAARFTADVADRGEGLVYMIG
jgi:hypothetical protein